MPMEWLTSLFAKRYFTSRKSHSVINIISRISTVAIGVPVAAMVILLSVFNGFQDLVKGMYTRFDPDIAVIATEGKVFRTDSVMMSQLTAIECVEIVSEILEDNGLLEYRGRQYIGMVRGVDSVYAKVVPIESMITDGSYELQAGEFMQAVAGQGIAYNLGIHTALLDPIRIMVPRREAFNSILPIDNYRAAEVFPAGIFALDAETDGKYVIVPIEVTRKLFDYPEGITTVMVKLKEGADPDEAKAKISATIGDRYKVLTRFQQKESLYRIMSYEKWGIFIIILMVLIISSFSVVGSLTMLIIDKKEDTRTIMNMGGSLRFVRKIFVKEGMIVSLVGAAGGMALGLIVCWAQIQFGLVRMPADTFLVDSYPVIVKMWDMVAVTATFIAVSYIITKFTVLKAIRRSDLWI